MLFRSASYGLTKDSMSSLMDDRNIYLNGWDEDINQEIIVTMIDSPLIDFNLYSNTTLSTMATSFESEYKNAGVTVIKYEIYQHSQAKFLKIYISQPNGDSTAYGLQYYTVYATKSSCFDTKHEDFFLHLSTDKPSEYRL